LNACLLDGAECERDAMNVVKAVDALTLESLRIEGFRNLSTVLFEPGPQFNVIHGDNGAGKSNLLEAIAYMATLASFRDAKKDDLIAIGQPAAALQARMRAEPLAHVHRIVLARDKARTVQVDGKRPTSLGTYYASIQLVLFHPGDVELMAGSPERRRAFLDRVLEQVDPSYARIRAEYEQALRSRNRLLKAERVDPRSVTAYDAILASHGARIGQARMRLSEELAPRVEAHFAEITDRALALEVRYLARHEPTPEALERALRDAYAKDLARGYTGVGPHGDDLKAQVAQHQAKHLASQGQHRALVLSLKIAELAVLEKRTGHVPLLLLDDVSSELDRSRNRRLFGLLARMGGQVFLTTTHPEYILLEESRRDFHVEAGQVRPRSP
jgi:DNA replication and repair protein RecF